MKISKLVIGSFILLLGMGQQVFADTCSTGLMPMFTGPQAEEICATFSAGTIGTLANNTYAVGRNAADSANIDVWKVDSTDDTVINADSGDTIKLAVAGTTVASVDSTGLVLSPGILNVAANVESVAGAGTTVADAAALSATKSFHRITGANGTVGWKFPSAVAGDVHFLLNTTAGVPKVYAVSGGTCNGGAADAACTLVTGIVLHACYATAANAWICA